MATKMHNPKTGETIRVPGRRVKDHLQNGYEIADGSEVPVGNINESEAKVTKEELYEQAQELDIEGRSNMSKEELQKAIDEAEDATDADDADTDPGLGTVIETGEDEKQQVPANLGEPSPDVLAETGDA